MASLLVLTVLLPFLGSLALALIPAPPARMARGVALGVALATLGASLALLLGFEPGVTDPQFAYRGEGGGYGLSWMPRLGIRFALGLDGISLWLLLLTSLLTVTAIFMSWHSIEDRASSYYALILALQGGMLGIFASLDVFLFYAFFEFTLIPLFFLIGIWGGPERRRASLTYFLYTLAGSLLTLLGVIALVAVYYRYSPNHVLTCSIPELTRGLADLPWHDWRNGPNWGDWRQGLPFWATPQVAIFLLLFSGFAIKVALFPFHSWLPLVYVESPTGATILLAGVMLKVGTYGFLRFNLGMTPLGAHALYPLIATLAVISILYGALAALAQTDMKRLVAYSSFSHAGFIMLGLFSLNATGMEGATIQMFNHGLTIGALLACVGMIQDRYRTREMTELGGLWARMPLWSFFMIVAAMGTAALPGLNGFVGEFPILLGMYRTSPTLAVFATGGMILGAYYLLWMLQKVAFGPLREPSVRPSEGQAIASPTGPRPVAWSDIAGLAPLLALILYIGVHPAPFVDRLKAPFRSVVANLTARPYVELPDGSPPIILSDPSRFRGMSPGGGGGRGPAAKAATAPPAEPTPGPATTPPPPPPPAAPGTPAPGRP